MLSQDVWPKPTNGTYGQKVQVPISVRGFPILQTDMARHFEMVDQLKAVKGIEKSEQTK